MPFEKRLRRINFWARLGHDVTAPNCFWAKPGDRMSQRAVMCQTCATLQRTGNG